jgi:exonuclease VII small subunit
LTKQGYRFLVFFVIILLAAVYVFVMGESGILERRELTKKKTAIEDRIAELERDRKKLEEVRESYRRGEMTDRDLVRSGYLKRNQEIVRFRGLDEEDEKEVTFPGESDIDLPITTGHIRILWLVFSVLVLVLVLLFIRRPGRGDDDREIL